MKSILYFGKGKRHNKIHTTQHPNLGQWYLGGFSVLLLLHGNIGQYVEKY